MDQRQRSAKGSSLSRLLLHARIEEDPERLVLGMMQHEDGKKTVQALLHGAAEVGLLDTIREPADALEAGLCYLPELRLESASCRYSPRKRNSKHQTTIPLIPKIKAPFRGQMFFSRDLEEEHQKGELVVRMENMLQLLGSSVFRRRSHASVKQADSTKHIGRSRPSTQCNN